MNKIKLLIGASTILLASAFTVIVSVDWKVKEDYKVEFTYGKIHAESKFCHFKGLKATILFDETSPEKSKIKATIDATTIDMGHEGVTAHAKEPDVLDVGKYPEITFESTAITKTISGYEATGNLTIKDVTKEIKFPFTFEKETFRGGFTIETKDYNITRQNAWKEVTIVLTIPVTQ